MIKDISAQVTEYNKVIQRSDKVACPNCSRLNNANAKDCQYCGAPFFSAHTSKLDSTVLTRAERIRRVGSAASDERQPIIFEIGLEHFVLPIADSLTVGRATPLDGEQPDIDLEPYLAQQYGISRLHLKITRSHDLIYVTDLQSLNGTRLNGYRLVPYQKRILRSGDELVIGRLSVYVKF
jgi:hypothetical protein